MSLCSTPAKTAMAIIAAIVLCAALLTGCAHQPTPESPPPPDPQLAADMEGSETGAAVGLLTTPAAVTFYKWIGHAILQILVNTKIETKIEVKVDAAAAPQKATP